MKYQPLPISKTYRQFVALARKVQQLLDSGTFRELSAQQQRQLSDKLRHLYRQLSAVFSKGRLRRILASAALVLGLGGGIVHAQQFAAPIQDPFGLEASENISFLAFADLDNDGDQDMLTIQYEYTFEEQQFVYYENTGTAQSPSFAAPQVAAFGLDNETYLTTPYLVDIDDDGDQDLFVGSYAGSGYVGQTLYFENLGTPESPAFASGITNPFGLQNSSYYMVPVFVDLDNDGDFDLLGTTYDENTERTQFHYQENTGTADAPQFGPVMNNPFGLLNEDISVIIHTLGDLDMDGDYDLLIGGSAYDYDEPAFVQYFENTGTPSAPAFNSPVDNPFGIAFPPTAYLTLPIFVDIDDDGDLDLFVSGYDYGLNPGEEDAPIWYFENTAVVNSAEEATPAASLKVFPTVTEGWLNWQAGSLQPSAEWQLEAFASDGRRVGSWPIDGQRQGQVNVSGLPGGLYQLRLSDASGRTLTQERFVVR